jgi:environmental stress-induced protein Ves
MIIDADRVTPVPWKNGGGVTRELLRWPDDGAWRLRLSLAHIDRDGPFSVFPGVTRWFVVLDGAGVALDFGHGEQCLRPGDAPLRFDGAAAPACRLLDGPTRDLNLMLQGLDGELQAVAAGSPAPAWPLRGFFETGPRRLHWPCDDDVAPGPGFWIGVRP